MDINTVKTVSFLSPNLREKLNEFHLREAALHAGYKKVSDWHPYSPKEWGTFPQAPVISHSVIYTGDSKSFAYSHHQTICKFKNLYVAGWSNGLIYEDHPGQEVHYSWSEDARPWVPWRVLVHTKPESGIIRHNCGMYATKDRLFAFVGVMEKIIKSGPGMVTHVSMKMHIDVYETRDLNDWKVYERVIEDVNLFEGPRPTREGRLLCSGVDNRNWRQEAIMLWDGLSDVSITPRTIILPESAEGVMPEQGTWYQTEKGRIYMFLRDGSFSCHLGITWSDDGGETWSQVLRTDIPNTYSRAYAGRLTDGRYYIVGNNYNIFLDRRHLLLALSDDGEKFDRMFTIVEGETTRRIQGYHKEDGYQYPNCIVDGNRLLVIYSRNKEDIECDVVDCSKL